MANTKPWDWFEAIDDKNLSVTQLHKLYTQAFFIVFLSIVVPIMLSSALNIMGWNGGIIIILFLATLFYIWVLSSPILLALKGAGMAFSGSVPGKTAAEIANKIYLAILYLILGSPIAHLLLAIFPLEGHGGQAFMMLAMVPLVVIGTVWLSSGDWVIRKFWHLYIAILLGCVGYWSLTSFFPDLQGSEASSRVHATHQTVRTQNNRYLAKKAEEIQQRISKMDESLSLEERIKRLNPEDRKIWEDSQKSSFTSRTAEASLPAIKETGKALSEGFSAAKAEALKVWHGEELIYQVSISSKGVPETKEICDLSIGDYKVSVRDVTAPSIVDEKGADMGVFDLSNTGRPGTQFGLTVGGKRIGETVTVSSKDSCLTVAVSMNGPTRTFFTNGSKYSFIGTALPAATLVLTR